MPRKSKTEYAILGLLSLRPMSGYDMKSFIGQSLGFFWQESYGQIYPTLKRLAEAGLVSSEVQTQAGRPDRHVYSITSEGIAHLSRWMEADTEPETVRHELLLKLFFGPITEPAVHRRQVETLLESQRQRLEQFDAVQNGFLAQFEGQPHFEYWLSTLRFGVHVTRARIAWCEETLGRIDAIQAKQSTHVTTSEETSK
jgi:DNA-binding PadR family transcriptional regulator